jgi:hypothetical protein
MFPRGLKPMHRTSVVLVGQYLNIRHRKIVTINIQTVSVPFLQLSAHRLTARGGILHGEGQPNPLPNNLAQQTVLPLCTNRAAYIGTGF